MIRGLKTRIRSISKSTSLLDSTAHISTFRTMKTLFLSMCKSTLLQDDIALIWTFRTWKCHSWLSANRPFAVRNCPYLNVLQLENRIREYQQNDHDPGQHYPYLNVLKPENTILENQQINNITERNNSYVTFSKFKKRYLWIIQSKSFHDCTAHFW